MKLKVRNLEWSAGRPVAILNGVTSKKNNIFVDERISIKGKKESFAVVDIFSKLVKKNEIGLSQELSKVVNLKNGTFVEVNSSEDSTSAYLIRKKLKGHTLNNKELDFIISEIVHNNLTEAEIAYFTAAQKLNGMSMEEIIGLTSAMIKTGAKLDFGGECVADKHCIGGVTGNRTTPILVAICVVAGLIIPKTSSRAITSAAGTADVIETISNVELSAKQIKAVVKKTGGCLAWGGSLGLAPSDDKIIRVERLLNLDIESQMLASIMSKKVSAGSRCLIIDIPYGKGCKIESLGEAKKLGRKFKQISKRFKLKLEVACTKGDQPIGNGFGPVLEMLDILKVLRNEKDAPQDLKEKSLFLASKLLKLCNAKSCRNKNSGRVAEEILSSGEAYNKFKEIIEVQNGKNNFDERISKLKPGKIRKTIFANKNGKIVSISNKEMNSLCRILGTPETISAGVYLHKHIGEIKNGEPLMTLYSESRIKLWKARRFIKKFNPIVIK